MSPLRAVLTAILGRASRRIERPEDATTQTMALWEERERRRAEILAHVDAADASLARGEGSALTQDAMRALANDVKQRGRARLAAESVAHR